MHQRVTRLIHVRALKPKYEPEIGADSLHFQPAAQGEVLQFVLMAFGSYP